MAGSSDESYYPPVGFYFKVDLVESAGSPPSSKSTVDNSFQEVGGLSVEYDSESVSEGGENRFAHKLPTKTKYQNLVLKRGLVLSSSKFSVWCLDTMSSNLGKAIAPKNIFVSLLNEKGTPAMTWQFFNAWPIKMQVSDLQAMENKIALETLEFSFQYYEQKAV